MMQEIRLAAASMALALVVFLMLGGRMLGESESRPRSKPDSSPTAIFSAMGVSHFCFSPDGKSLVATDWRQKPWTVRIWDIKKGKQLVSFAVPNKPYYIVYSPNAKQLVVVESLRIAGQSGGAVTYYDTRTWQPRRRMLIPKCAVPPVYSPDGKYFAIGRNISDLHNEVLLFETAEFKEIAVLKAAKNTGGARRLAFSSDGKMLAAASGPTKQRKYGGFVTIWNIPCCQERTTIKAKFPAPRQTPGIIEDFCFLPNGREIAIAYQSAPVAMVDLQLGTTRDDFYHVYCSGKIAPLFHSRYLAVSKQSRIDIWRTDQKRRLNAIDVGRGIRHLATSPNGTLLAASDAAGMIRVWRWQTIFDWTNRQPAPGTPVRERISQKDWLRGLYKNGGQNPDGRFQRRKPRLHWRPDEKPREMHKSYKDRLREKYRKGPPTRPIAPPNSNPPDRRPRIAPDAIPRRKDIG